MSEKVGCRPIFCWNSYMLCLLRISVDLNFGVTSIGTQCMSIVDELENYTVVVAQPTPSLLSSGIRIVLLESKEVYETSHNCTHTHTCGEEWDVHWFISPLCSVMCDGAWIGLPTCAWMQESHFALLPSSFVVCRLHTSSFSNCTSFSLYSGQCNNISFIFWLLSQFTSLYNLY